MTFLSILLSVMMTFTVDTKSSIITSGTCPNTLSAQYACTYQKGTVRAGDTATLDLSGLQHIQLEQVRVYMRSNKSAGAGELTIMADNSQLYELNGTYKDWFGAYNNSNYQPIGWTGSLQLLEGALQIQLIGTTNSLYIEKYEVVYSQLPAETHTVTLHAGEDIRTLTETAPGSGVVLPECEQRNEWFFLGWSDTDIQEPIIDKPTCYMPGTTYYPTQDESLYALWTDLEPPTGEPAVEPKSGYYLLAIRNSLLTGVASNGLIKLLPFSNRYYDDQIYYLDFCSTDTTLTIHNYVYDKQVGHNEQLTSLTVDSSVWHYRFLPDSTCLIYAAQEEDRYWILYPKSESTMAEINWYRLGDNPNHLWTLYRVPDPNVQARYWSHPWHTAMESVPAPHIDYTIPFGPYRLHIHDGQKTLQL